jgi:excisionase family DNA binding protein
VDGLQCLSYEIKYEGSARTTISAQVAGDQLDEKDGRPPLTISQAARKLNVSDQAARNALLRGELHGFRIGRAWRITPDSVDRKLAEEVA